MIRDIDAALAVLVEACPTFRPRHAAMLQAAEAEEEELSFSDKTEALRQHVLGLIAAGQHEADLNRVFDAIEGLLSGGGGHVRSALGVALIEHTKRVKWPPGPEREAQRAFRKRLGTVGRKEWDIV